MRIPEALNEAPISIGEDAAWFTRAPVAPAREIAGCLKTARLAAPVEMHPPMA